MHISIITDEGTEMRTKDTGVEIECSTEFRRMVLRVRETNSDVIVAIKINSQVFGPLSLSELTDILKRC